MQKGRPQTARQYVVRALRSEILRGDHPAGTRLRQEEIAARLGVSTTPVREAFRDLLAEGLINLDAHRGALVRSLTLSDVRELYELRIVLEPMLARRAISSATTESFDEPTELHARLCAEDDPERWSSLNVHFHQALHKPAQESRLAHIVDSLASAASAYVSLSMHATPELMTLNNEDHAELLRLYRERDEDGAALKTADHLEQTLRAIEHNVQQGQAKLRAG